MTSLSNKDEAWQLTAIDGFWPDPDKPEITLQSPPKLNACYDIELTNTVVKQSNGINILYEPPLAFYNGFETVEDIIQLRICSGIVEHAGDVGQTDDLYKDSLQKIKFRVTSTTPFDDLKNLSSKKMLDENWGSEFMSGGYFLNVQRIGKFVIVNWSSDAYAGEECVLIQEGPAFQALYLTGHFIGESNWVRAGNLVPPQKFVDRLSQRLFEMENKQHWRGGSL